MTRLIGLTKGFAAILVALLLAIPAMAQDQRPGESAVQTVVKRGKLMVGLSTFVPWAMRDKKGELIGFEIDVAKQLAKDIGVELELVPTAFDGIIPALLASKFDLIATGLTITPKRGLTINFSRPYNRSGAMMLANTKLTAGFKTLEDYNKPNVTLAARRGSTGALTFQTLFPKATLRLFDDEQLANQEVINGNAHGASAQPPRPYILKAKYPDVLTIPFEQVLSHNSDAFGIRPGDVDTLNFLDNWIEFQTNSGWLEERQKYWFRSAEWVELVPQ
ncbi:MAG: transporter substrate-binding domain-containing protein [Proteobacteria bacterium]|nr:transporter substrate-binding domain-containing protein [Pseudomonadota bacterium]